MGELLKQFDAQGRRTDQLSEGALTKLSQKEAAESAGISRHRQVQAVRVANVPAEQFDAKTKPPVGPEPPARDALQVECR